MILAAGFQNENKAKSLQSKLWKIMKLTIAFLLFFTFQISAKGNAQKITIVKNNIPLSEVFKIIEQQTQYLFFYDKNLIQKKEPIDISIMNVTLDQALLVCLKGQQLNYIIVKNTIVIQPQKISNLVSFQIANVTALPPPVEIHGRVVDQKGEPLQNVSVIISSTKIGTTTNSDGRFTLTVSNTKDIILEISSVGFQTQRVKVGNLTEINISLQEEVTGLSNVVVIGYGTAKKKDLTGSVSSINSDQIEKVPVTTLEQALQGRSAGVQVTNDDGSPGAGISIKIRGTGTFGDNSPLYVVDGYPVSGNISYLDPADVASIDILKDASATAIYGNRASNGVVIITTKRGNGKDGLQVSLSAQMSIQSKPKFYDVMNAEQFAMAAHEVSQTEGYPILPEWNNPSGLKNIDWQNAIYQTGLRQNYNIALRGGDKKVQTSFSLGYVKQKGIVIFSDFSRYNLSLNLDYKPIKWLKASTSVKYYRIDKEVRFGSGINQIGTIITSIPTMTGNPVTNEIKDANGNYGFYTQAVQSTLSSNNVIADLEDQETRNPTNGLLTNGFLELTFIEGLKFKSSFGVEVENNSGYNFKKSNERSVPPALASYSQKASDSFEWLLENTLAYTRSFGIHSIDFVGGISSQENTSRRMSTSGTGLVSNDLRDIGSLETVTPIGYQQTWSLASQFGRLAYKLLDRYLLTGTIRHDGSSRFGTGKKWGIFPSIAAAWNISEEPFMNQIPFINNLKLRGSWGKTGNQNIGLFQYQSTYGIGTSIQDNRGYVFGIDKAYQQGLALNSLENINLTWETSLQSNLGIDASFLNNHINITANYYIKKSSDFLLNVPVPAQTGFTTATKNVGSIKNSGLELSLEYRESAKKFKWAVSLNLTTIKNEILSFTEGLTAISNFTNAFGFMAQGANIWTVYSQSQIGGNIGTFYGFKSDGIYQTQAEIDALNAKAKAKYGASTSYQTKLTSPGDRKFVDVNGDGRITDDDRVNIGSPIPKLFGGLNFDGSYKRFDFSLFWYASIDNKILNYAKRNLQTFNKAQNGGLQNMGAEYYNNYWKADRPSDTYTRLLAYDQVGNNRPSDIYVEDGSFIRLKNLQIGYTLPIHFANKMRVFISGQNLITITKYSGLDPEIGDIGGVTGTGIDIGTYPTTRYYSFGLNVTF